MYKDRKECLLVGKVNQSTVSIKMGVARSYAASIIFNETTLWIVGGEQGGGWIQHNSTEFITIDSKQQMTQAYGPELPFGISKHCMVKFNSTTIYLIGGSMGVGTISKKVWIIDPTQNFTMTEGPSLSGNKSPKSMEIFTSCGKMKYNDTDVIVVVGSREYLEVDTVEILFPTGWVKGNYSMYF